MLENHNGVNVFVRSAPPVIEIDSEDGYQSFSKLKEVRHLNKRFNIYTNSGLTVVMKAVLLKTWQAAFGVFFGEFDTAVQMNDTMTTFISKEVMVP